MFYVMEKGPAGYRMLHEMDSREYRAAQAEARQSPDRHFDMVPASVAHKWVREGNLHSTPLYVGDGNRVRKAEAGC